MKPGGRYLMFDLDRVGGVPVVMKRLLEAGLLHGDCMTVTGKTVEENLEDWPDFGDTNVVKTVDAPLSSTGGLVSLFGNLAPQGCILKVAGHQFWSTMVRHGQGVQPGRAGHGRSEATRNRGRRRGGDPL